MRESSFVEADAFLGLSVELIMKVSWLTSLGSRHVLGFGSDSVLLMWSLLPMNKTFGK